MVGVVVDGPRRPGRGVVDGDLLAGHPHHDLAAGHRHDAHAPADAAPGHGPLPADGPDEHGRRDGLDAHVAHHRLEETEVPDGPQALLLPHEQRVGRQAGGAVRLRVDLGLDPGHRLGEAAPPGELAAVGEQAVQEAVGRLVLALGLRRARRAEPELEAGLPREPPRPLLPGPPAARDGHQARHVVRDALLRDAAEAGEGGEQAGQQVVERAAPDRYEAVLPGVAERRGEHAELEDLALRVDEPHALLPVELQLPARGRLEPRVRLAAARAPEGHVVRAAPRGEGAVPGQPLPAALAQERVDCHLGHPGQLGLRADHLLERVEGAAPRGPPVGGGLALPPVLGDRVPVHAVPPRDLAEVRLRAGPPVDVQLSHYVSLHIPLLPGRIPDRSIVPLAQLVKVR